MKQIQINIQEIKYSIAIICNRMSQHEDRISDIKDRIVISDYEKKDFLKIEKGHEQ